MKKYTQKALAAALAISLMCGVTVAPSLSEAAGIKLNKTSLKLKEGKTYKLKVSGKYSGKVKWSSSKKKVASVSSKGVVKALSKGKATITAKVAKKKLKCIVTVNPKNAVQETQSPSNTQTTVPQVTQPATQTQTPAQPTQASQSQAPQATQTPVPTDAPEPTATPKYMSEGAFVYDKLDISWIDKDKPMIAFTFDDGPVGSSDTSNSIRIQNALKEYGFHATFNYVTSKINNNSMTEEIKMAMENGNEVANHTSQWSSLSDTKAFPEGEDISAEIEKARAKLEEVTGISNFTLRPPNLGVSELVYANCNVPLIGCNIISNDWEDNTTKEHIIEVTKKAKDGDIVLFHETMKNTTEAVEELVPYFAEQGYQIVSVVELFAAKDIPLYAGNYYNKAEYMEPRE